MNFWVVWTGYPLTTTSLTSVVTTNCLSTSERRISGAIANAALSYTKLVASSHTHTHTTLLLATARSLDWAFYRGGRGGFAPRVPMYASPSDNVSCVALHHLPCSTTWCCLRAFPRWCIRVALPIHGKQIGGSASFWVRGTPLSRGSSYALRPLPSLVVGWWKWAIRTWDARQPRVRDAGPPKRPRPDVAIPRASRQSCRAIGGGRGAHDGFASGHRLRSGR